MSDYLVVAPIPPDGRLQVFAHVNSGGTVQLHTRTKATSDPNSLWTFPWAPFVPPPPPAPFPNAPIFEDMTAGVLSDGRTQIWGLHFDGQVYTTRKVSTAPDSPWEPWRVFDITPITDPRNRPIGVSAAALPDKRLQLFFIGPYPDLQIWTTWQTTRDPNSRWTKLQIL